jgi:transposase
MSEVSGFDVAKKEMIVWFRGGQVKLENQRKPIERFLRTLPPGTKIAVESTGRMHWKLVEAALALDLPVYVLNPREVKMYRRSLNFRVKSDVVDAEAIARFVEKEHERLRIYVPPGAKAALGAELMGHRDKLVHCRMRLTASMSEMPAEVRKTLESSENALKSLTQAIEDLDRRLQELLRDEALYKRLLKVPGFGPLTAGALTLLLTRIKFQRADSLVAFVGLDLEVRDSGTKTGQRRLTKRGDRRLRCLLYTAATAGLRCECWKPFYQNAKAKGWKSTQAILILARKMLRTAWAIAEKNVDFNPQMLKPLDATP